MKRRVLGLGVLLATLSLMLGSVSAHAQATPSATPTPGSCALTPPGLTSANCNTGAEVPPAFLGVSGGNINSVAISKTGGVNCCSGTLGALVEDAAATPYVLSTNHTFARTS